MTRKVNWPWVRYRLRRVTCRHEWAAYLTNWPAQEKPPLSVQGCRRVGCGVYRWAPWRAQMNQRSERE